MTNQITNNIISVPEKYEMKHTFEDKDVEEVFQDDGKEV